MHLTAFFRSVSWQNGSVQKVIKVMKITAVLMILGCLAASASGHSQQITLSRQNAPLVSVLADIEKQSRYDFIFTYELVEKAGRVDINVKDATLQQALDKLLAGKSLGYTIIERTVVIKPKVAQINKSEIAIEPPPIDVTGKVVDSTGSPLQGASVRVRGTKLGTTTDSFGNFTLSNVDGKAILEISYSGYKTVTLSATNVAGLANVVLRVDIRESDVVLVNTGYQQLKPNEVTGSVVVITREQLDQRVETNIISKLEGITNGLVFNKTSDGENKLRIRGESTIFAYAEPLIFVDNFPYTGDLNSINPNDIETITILKDAAAASMSGGAQSGNGVIVITTKRGKYNQPISLTITSNIIIEDKPDLFYRPQIGTSDWIDIEGMLFNRGFYAPTLADPTLPAVSPVVEILNQQKLGLLSSDVALAKLDSLRRFDWRKDFDKYIYQKAIKQQYYINVSGGSTKMKYVLSGGLDRSTTNKVGNSSNRITFSSRTSYMPIKRLEVSADISFTESNNINNAYSGGMVGIYPYTRLMIDGVEQSIPRHRQVFEDTIGAHGFPDWKYYPIKDQRYRENRTKTIATQLRTAIKYNITKGLDVDVSYQFLRTHSTSKNLAKKDSWEMRDARNTFAIVSNGNYIGTNYLLGGRLSFSSGEQISHNGRMSLSIDRTFNRHRINGFFGTEIRETSNEERSYELYGFDEETGTFSQPNVLFFTNYPTYPAGTGTIGSPNFSYGAGMKRFLSYFGTFSYSFQSRYFFYSSFRTDGANLFGVKTNNKFAPLLTTGLKWDITREKFFKSSLFNLLSFRVAYGASGNVHPELAAVTTIRLFSLPAGIQGGSIANIPNPQLRWEKSRQLNLGIDFSIWKSRVSGTIEYFSKKGIDIIGDAPLDRTTGVTTLRGNFSGMHTKGLDISISTKNFVSRKFQWNTIFNFSFAADKITKYDMPYLASGLVESISNFISPYPKVGEPIYGLYSFRWGGLDPLTGDPRIILGDTLNKTYTSANLSNITYDDLVYHGRYNPPITGNIYNSLSWKGFTLSLNFTYKLNYYFRRRSIRYSGLTGTDSWRSIHPDFALRWRKPGDEQFTDVPSLIYPFSSSNPIKESYYANSNLLVEKGDHIRFQFLTINYNLGSTFAKKLKANSLNVYVNINNIGIIWRANNAKIDPDNQVSDYPTPRNYAIGLRASF